MLTNTNSIFQIDNQNNKIWRYLDFSKFLDLIISKTLYFSKLRDLEDHFEGSISKYEYLKRKNEITNNEITIRQQIESHPKLKHLIKTDPQMIQELQKLKDEGVFGSDEEKEKKANLNRLETIAVNCWHINETESEAMWKLYSQSESGIAIISNVRRFSDVLDKSDANVFIGKIKYIDYGISEENAMDENKKYMYKRQSFNHENELRAIINLEDFSNSKLFQGKPIKVGIDVNELINEVKLSPFMPKWQENLIKDITNQLGFNKKISRSDLEMKQWY